MKDQVYLAGPMEDCSTDHMTGWRQLTADALELSDINTLDPTRRVSFHDQLGENLQDIAESKVVLADVRRSSGRGTGTSMELMFAHTKNKIIILWADEGDFIHPFYEAMATEKHYSLEEAVDSVRLYY